MPEDKHNIQEEQLSSVSGGGHFVDASMDGDRLPADYSFLERQPVEDEAGLHCPIVGCSGFLDYDLEQGSYWRFHCPVCGRVFLKRKSDQVWLIRR